MKTPVLKAESNPSDISLPMKSESEGVSNQDDSAKGNNNCKQAKDHSDGRLKTSSSVIHKQSYEYAGENAHVGIILTLPSEKFSNKVVFSAFIDKTKNYVLTNFTGRKDLMPILEFMKDPKPSVDADEPKDLYIDDTKSEMKRWMKQEEVKLHIKCLTALEHNQEKCTP